MVDANSSLHHSACNANTKELQASPATIPVVTLSIAIPLDQARELADLGLAATVTATPSMLRAAVGKASDPREKFSRLDALIASVLDESGPAQAAEVVRLLDEEHDEIQSENNIRKRFMRGMPLHSAGYRNTSGLGYASPSSRS